MRLEEGVRRWLIGERRGVPFVDAIKTFSRPPRSPVDFQDLGDHEVPLGPVRPGDCLRGRLRHSITDGAECLILWTSHLVRRVKELVFYIPPTYYHGTPPIYTPVTFFGGGSGVPAGRPFYPGGIRPVTPKPGGRKPLTPRPAATKPSTQKPGGDKSKGTKATTRRPPGTKPTTLRTTQSTTTESTIDTTPQVTESSLDETTKRPFYNMLCGVCPPMKQCLCPGVHF